MLLRIRYGVFETNSSSVHSLSVPRESNKKIDPEETRKRYGGQPLVVQFGEFGWGPETLRSLEGKLSYIVTSMQYYMKYEEFPDSLPVNDKLQKLYATDWYKWLKELILQYTSWTDLILKVQEGWYPLGYVDHQSTDTLADLFHADEQEFKELATLILFHDESRIYIYNDNDSM